MAKRSSIYPKEDARVSGTNEKVARDLQAMFGGETEVLDEKKKRSSGDQTGKTISSITTAKPHKIEKKSDRSVDDDNVARQDQSQHYDDYQKDKPDHVHDEEYHENDHDHEVMFIQYMHLLRYLHFSCSTNMIMRKTRTTMILRMMKTMIKRKNGLQLK